MFAVCQYEQKRQIASGAFSSVFCVRPRGRRQSRTLYTAKYLKVGFLNFYIDTALYIDLVLMLNFSRFIF